MKEPNSKQKDLINKHDGIFKVDAGAGTGKTFTLTRRYAKILEEKDVDPQELLLLTFTRNAAEEMQERIIGHCDADLNDLREAPISTFHSFCRSIITDNGFQIPRLIGINDDISQSTRIIENELLEKQEFKEFIHQFIEEHPEYENFFKIQYDYSSLLDLIKSLASKGVLPTENEWYRNTENYLNGDKELFEDKLSEVNTPNGNRQSPLRDKVGKVYRNKCLLNDVPDKENVRGTRGTKQAETEFFIQAYEEDRDSLFEFVHDIYFEYLKFCLNRNYINFSFLQSFAFVLLCEDDQIRQKNSFEYVMLDEFQDTSEIQLKIAMLLAKGNICAVGDWKQSIYSFRYASVENILQFEDRLLKFKEDLNEDAERVSYSIEKDEIRKIDLEKNYRSTQDILDFSEQSLLIKGKRKEKIDTEDIKNRITSLKTDKPDHHTSIEALEAENEPEGILAKIQKIVDNEDYRINEGDKPSYEDIVILTRTRNFGLELQKVAREYGVPLSFEGGVELFKTKPAILLLAWLRVLEYKHSTKGWSVILEEAGYNYGQIKKILDSEDYPEEMVSFRKSLQKTDHLASKAAKIFNKYGINDGFSNKIIDVMHDTFSNTYRNLGEIILFIEDNIEEGKTYNVDNDQGENSVTIQTIHSVKGLEYPIVFVSDINDKRFPNNNNGGPRITYDDMLGLRQKKVYSEDHQHIFDHWPTYFLNAVKPNRHDEERRLLYVAMTRAEQHLVLTAEEDRVSKFFENLDIEPEEYNEQPEQVEIEDSNRPEVQFKGPKTEVAVKRSVHSIMEAPEDGGIGRGPDFGDKVHKFAEEYVLDRSLTPDNSDEENVAEFIDNLDGELKTEVVFKAPMDWNGRKTVFNGVMDLVHVKDDEVEVIDYKTVLDRSNESEYLKQLNIYKAALNDLYPEKEVSGFIFYTKEGQKVELGLEKTVA